jgi:hypothetical protein
LVGEEQPGLEAVLGVEDDGGWKGFWGGDKKIFRVKAHEGGSSRKMDRDLRIFKIGFMRHGGTKAENGAGSEQQ